MKRRLILIWSVCVMVGLVLIVSGCGKLQKPVVLEAKTHNVIAIKMIDYKFEPNNIQTMLGDTLVLKVENTSLKLHNFTLEDPQGKTIYSMDIDPQKTVEVRPPLSRGGIYKFYSNKFLQSTRGMKGQIIVIGHK